MKKEKEALKYTMQDAGISDNRRTKRQEIIRQTFADLIAAEIPQSIHMDRSEEGKEKLREMIEDIRYRKFMELWKDDITETAIMKTGKEQLLRVKSTGLIKFGSWELTHNSWSIVSKLKREVIQLGFYTIYQNGKVLPYAITQKWHTPFRN